MKTKNTIKTVLIAFFLVCLIVIAFFLPGIFFMLPNDGVGFGQYSSVYEETESGEGAESVRNRLSAFAANREECYITEFVSAVDEETLRTLFIEIMNQPVMEILVELDWINIEYLSENISEENVVNISKYAVNTVGEMDFGLWYIELDIYKNMKMQVLADVTDYTVYYVQMASTYDNIYYSDFNYNTVGERYMALFDGEIPGKTLQNMCYYYEVDPIEYAKLGYTTDDNCIIPFEAGNEYFSFPLLYDDNQLTFQIYYKNEAVVSESYAPDLCVGILEIANLIP